MVVMYSSQLSNFSIFILFTLLSLYFTFNPQRFVRLHLVGEYVPIFPTGFLGFRQAVHMLVVRVVFQVYV